MHSADAGFYVVEPPRAGSPSKQVIIINASFTWVCSVLTDALLETHIGMTQKYLAQHLWCGAAQARMGDGVV